MHLQASVESFGIGLERKKNVFPRFATRGRDLPLHLGGVVLKKGHSIAIAVQKRIVNLVLYRLLIRRLRFIELVHGRIQSHEVGEGRCAARVKRRSSRLAATAFSYCPK